MEKLLIFYLIIFFFSSIVYVYKTDFTFSSYGVDKSLYLKYFLIWISTLCITYSLFITNNIINKYVLPILLFLNVGTLMFISIKNDNFTNKLHYISLIGIIYLLFTFSNDKFMTINGKLIHIDKKWLYIYILILLSWFTTSSYISLKSKLICVGLILYPLFYPIEEYFIHRLYSLVGVYLILNYKE